MLILGWDSLNLIHTHALPCLVTADLEDCVAGDCPNRSRVNAR